MDDLKLMTFRLAAVDVAILDALRDKFGLRSRADALRYAMRRTAEAEGVDVAQQKAKPKRRKAALPHKGRAAGGRSPAVQSLDDNHQADQPRNTMTSTASPRPGHATEPKAPPRPQLAAFETPPTEGAL